jgi:hypothetical protein
MGLRARGNKERQAVSETPKKVEQPGENRQFKAGIAVGVGSAAIVAALLYARSNKPRKK